MNFMHSPSSDNSRSLKRNNCSGHGSFTFKTTFASIILDAAKDEKENWREEVVRRESSQ